MLLLIVEMLKKRLGAEGIEKVWSEGHISYYYKIPTSIIIPEGCKEIGYYAFLDCRKLKKVEIPGSVKSIGVHAFNGCYNLKEVVIPEGVESIGHYAFYCCRDLKKVEISGSVEYIDSWAFGGCENAEVILKKPWSEFKGIASNAFMNCKSVRAMGADEIRSLRLLEEFLTAKTC